MITDLITLLKQTEEFRLKYGINPHDNYAWREFMSFEYMRAVFPSILKKKGRYGADGICPELGLISVEHKSVNATIRKTTNKYNLENLYFEFDVSESRFKHFDQIDGFMFAMYDRDSVNHPYPVLVLFSYGESLKGLKNEIIKERDKFFTDAKRKRDTIEMYYPVLEKYSFVYTGLPVKQDYMYDLKSTLPLEYI
jgi:hypothetical protein